jgi:ribonuclease Y
MVALLVFTAYWGRRRANETVAKAEEEAGHILRDAQKETENLKKEAILEAKEADYNLRADFEKHTRDRRQELSSLEGRLAQKENGLDERTRSVDMTETELVEREGVLEQLEVETKRLRQDYEEQRQEQRNRLERLAGLTAEDAKRQLIKGLEQEARRDAAHIVRRIEEEAREQAEVLARRYVVEAIQRSAADHAAETTVSAVDLPNDDLKGRIIGREGRNIRALETATGVDLIVDDTPGAIILSGFDPIRREVARLAIEQLIADGRIHPARIEEVVERVRAELEEHMCQEGEAAAFELGFTICTPS